MVKEDLLQPDIKNRIGYVLDMTWNDLPSEDEIISSWSGDLEQPIVSVICNTFNHKAYIESALNSFLIQQTSFPFEIIVHDDASTDGTTDIVRIYQERYPRIIKAVIQVSNQYSKGKKPTLMSWPYAKGEFIALCEGDDFWIGADKIANQKKALEENLNLNFCSHSSAAIDLQGKVLSLILKVKNRSVVSAAEAIRGGGGFCATSSIMVRRKIIQNFSDSFIDAPVGDLFIQALGAVHGGVIVLDEISSVYRVRVPGGWSQTVVEPEKMLLHHDKMQSSLDKLKSIEGFDPYGREINVLKSRCSYNSAIAFLRAKKYLLFLKMAFRSIAHSPVFGLKRIVFSFVASGACIFQRRLLKQ